MTMTLKAHFDGKVFVPDEPVSLAAGQAVSLVMDVPDDEVKTMSGLQASFGVWKGRFTDGLAYEEKVRQDWDGGRP